MRISSASVRHLCGERFRVNYSFQVDVLLNALYCHVCLKKFWPWLRSVDWEGEPDDGTIDFKTGEIK